MKQTIILLFIILASAGCRQTGVRNDEKIITVSIPPFGYFVEETAGDKFQVNIMVPPGSDPHIYEPYPEQISKLSRSAGYISNGYLGFESVWMERFYEINKGMRKLSLGEAIEPLSPVHDHDDNIHEIADPHYWVSPVSAKIMARKIKEFLKELDPDNSSYYESNSEKLMGKINSLDKKASELFSSTERKSFMIFHPSLAYLARDYGLEEVAVEWEGKEPSPARLKELIDRAHRENHKVIFVQRELDIKYAKVIAQEAGLKVVVIDPLSPDWFTATNDIINFLYESLK